MNHRQVRSLLWVAVAASGLVQAQQTGTAVTGRPGGGGHREQGSTVIVGGGFESTDNAYKSTGTWSGCDDKHLNHPNRPSCIPVEDETKGYVDLQLGYLRSGSALTADVMYNAELANYENDTTDDDSVFEGHSKLAWRTLGNRLVLDASHDRSEQISDPRNPDIRNNRQVRDILSAGPALTARLSPVDDLVVDGRWMDIAYDEADRDPVTTDCPPDAIPGVTPGCPGTTTDANPDSQRLQGGLAWRHKLARTDVISANYQYIDTEFDETDPTVANPQPLEQIEYQRLFAAYEVELRASGYTIALGANRSERDNGDSSDGFLAQVSWHMETGGHRLRLVAINEMTDSAIGLGGNALAGGDYSPQDGNFNVVDVVERTSIDLGWGIDRICERCMLDLGLAYDRQDFDVEPRDQEVVGLRASFGYRLTPTLTASLRVSGTETDFPDDVTGGRTDERSTVGLFVDWRMSRALSSRFWISSDTRESDAPGADYDELFGGASVRYQFR